MRRILLLGLALLAAALPASLPASAAPAAAEADIARATALSHQWGRCPTARPAAAVLAQAVRSAKPVPRARRARAAVRAWTAVARACAQPVPAPAVDPGS